MGFAEMGICVEHVHVLKPACKFTLAMLADRADPFDDPQKTMRRTDGRVVCWPSVQDLAHRTGQSRSTVHRQLKELEQLGIIEIRRRWIRNEDGQARQTTSQYVINLPDMLAGRFHGEPAGKSVNLTPKPGEAKTAGHAKSVKMTLKQGKSVKNGQSKSVTGDTPYKDQYLTTIPSPPSPPLCDSEPEPPTSVAQQGAAGPRLGEPTGSLGMTSSPESAPPAAPSGAGRPDEPTDDRHRSALRGSQRRRKVAPEEVSGGSEKPPENSPQDPNRATSARPGGSANDSGVISADVALVSAVLPEAMLVMPPRDYSRVAAAIRERLEAGWTRAQMRAVLESRALPDEIRHMTALVLARFRDDLPISTPPSWTTTSGANSRKERWSRTLPSGRVVEAADLDMGQVSIDFYAARQAGLEHAQGDKWEFLDAVGVSPYLIT